MNSAIHSFINKSDSFFFRRSSTLVLLLLVSWSVQDSKFLRIFLLSFFGNCRISCFSISNYSIMLKSGFSRSISVVPLAVLPPASLSAGSSIYSVSARRPTIDDEAFLTFYFFSVKEAFAALVSLASIMS